MFETTTLSPSSTIVYRLGNIQISKKRVLDFVAVLHLCFLETKKRKRKSVNLKVKSKKKRKTLLLQFHFCSVRFANSTNWHKSRQSWSFAHQMLQCLILCCVGVFLQVIAAKSRSNDEMDHPLGR